MKPSAECEANFGNKEGISLNRTFGLNLNPSLAPFVLPPSPHPHHSNTHHQVPIPVPTPNPTATLPTQYTDTHHTIIHHLIDRFIGDQYTKTHCHCIQANPHYLNIHHNHQTNPLFPTTTATNPPLPYIETHHTHTTTHTSSTQIHTPLHHTNHTYTHTHHYSTKPFYQVFSTRQ